MGGDLHWGCPVERLPVKPAMTIWCHALPSSPSCPTLFPRHARPSLTSSSLPSCPTPIGHLRLPVKPAMTICCTGNDDMVPCTSFSSVMPDSDRAPNTFMPNYRKNRRQITENNRIFCHFAIFSYLCGRKKTLLFRLKIG